jgi:hypothetical protein
MKKEDSALEMNIFVDLQPFWIVLLNAKEHHGHYSLGLTITTTTLNLNGTNSGKYESILKITFITLECER